MNYHLFYLYYTGASNMVENRNLKNKTGFKTKINKFFIGF